MIKRIITAVVLVVLSSIGFAHVASADNCPSNAACSTPMPTVPVLGNPLASTTTSTTATPAQTSTQVVPTTTTQQSSTNGAPTISVPTVPVQTTSIQVPTIDVPKINAPAAVNGTTGSTAQQAPVIEVPKMTWGDEGTVTGSGPTAVDPSPAYPSVTPSGKSGSSSNAPVAPTTSGSSNGVVTVDPQAVFPTMPSSNGGFPSGSLLLVGLGALTAISYRAAKERGAVLVAKKDANRQEATS